MAALYNLLNSMIETVSIDSAGDVILDSAGEIMLQTYAQDQFKILERLWNNTNLKPKSATQSANMSDVMTQSPSKALDDEVSQFCTNEPRLKLLKIYKQLYNLGYRIQNIDIEIRKEEKKG